MVRIRLLAALLLVLTACGGAAETTTTAPAVTAAAPTTTSTTSGATTAAAPTTEAPATTSTTTTEVPTQTLPDGRPATFLAITDDYAAVEIDTATGEILHVFGQTGNAAEMAAAEEMPPNVLVGAWRTADGLGIGLSDCCEPAAGRLFYLGADEELGDDPYSTTGPWNTGWTVSPAPGSNQFAVMGYSLLILDPTVPGEASFEVWIDEPDLGFPTGAAAWARDESAVFWTALLDNVTMLVSLDLGVRVPNPVSVLEWVGVNQYLDGIGSQASGNLVGFLHTRNADFEVVATEGVVFSTSGELLASFPVETGSLWGGYDPSGRFLIYVDGEDQVRWQGVGQAGTLGEGFYFASW